MNVGDTVVADLKLTKKLDDTCFYKGAKVQMKGVVCADLGADVNVIWTHIKPLTSGCSRKIKNHIKSKRTTYAYTGWCGVTPEMLFNKDSNKPNSVPKFKLTIVKKDVPKIEVVVRLLVEKL